MTITLERSPRGEVIVRTNECVNPSFETTQAPWTNLWFGSGGAGRDVWATTTWPPNVVGTRLLQKEWTTAPAANEDAGWRLVHTWYGGDWAPKTISCNVYCSNREVPFAIKAYFKNASGGVISSATSPSTITSIGGWIRHSAVFSNPPGTVTAQLDFVLLNGNTVLNNTVLAMDAVLIEPGSVNYPYFDGDTWPAGNGTQRTAWDGTAHQSASRLYDWDPATKWSPQLVQGYDVAQASRNIVHQLMDGAVAATLLPASGRQGTLRLFFLDAASAENARKTLAGAGTWTYADTDQAQESMTFVVDGQVRKYQSDNRLRWSVEVPYRELI